MVSSSEVMVRSVTPLPVVRQAESVCLVPGPLKQPKRRTAAREPQALGPARQEDLLFALGQAHDRQRLQPSWVAASTAALS